MKNNINENEINTNSNLKIIKIIDNNNNNNNINNNNNDNNNNNISKKKKKEKKTPKKNIVSPEEIEKYKSQQERIVKPFIEYYKEILGFSQKEFDEFLKISIKDLPITFRINKIYTYTDYLEKELFTEFYKDPNYLTNRIKRYKFNFLDNIYELDKFDKNNEIDMKIKQILSRQNDIGILRQELVAMIPINLVPINDDSIILDMCSAPGNKSIQILEIMEESARLKNILPRGILICNDINAKRAGNMSHFFKSHFPMNIIVTNMPAENLPIIKKDTFKPDVVICDVPCSGDGTLRKNKGLRKRWRIDYGIENHTIQFNILNNAVKQVKKGGYIVYSTCSINPIENEAVVAAILERNKNVEIVNVNKKLNEMGIKYREGLVKWKVCVYDEDKKYVFLKNFSEVGKKNDMIKETMFHDVYTKENYREKNGLYSFTDPLNLRKCIRIYSHDNNCGCFFICVLKKNYEIEDNNNIYSVPLNIEKNKTIGEDLDEFIDFLGLEKEEKNENKMNFFQTEIKEEKNQNEEEKNQNEQEKNNNININNNEIIFKKYENIKKFKDSFDNLNLIFKFKNENIIKYLYCSRETSHKVYLFSEKLVEMIDIISQMNINIIRSGVVVFKKERLDIKSKYRITYDGAILLSDYFENQILELENGDLLKILFNRKDLDLNFNDFEDEKLKEKLMKFEEGSVILIYEGFVLVGRRGKGTLRLMLPKKQIESIKKYFFESLN